MIANEFRLAPHEIATTCAARLKEHYAARLLELRASNDADKTPEQTARLRGRIAEVKAFLALVDPAREHQAGDGFAPGRNTGDEA